MSHLKTLNLIDKMIKDNYKLLKTIHEKDIEYILNDKFKIGYITNDIIKVRNKNIASLIIIPFTQTFYETLNTQKEKNIDAIFDEIKKKKINLIKFNLSKFNKINDKDNIIRNFINNNGIKHKFENINCNLFNFINNLKFEKNRVYLFDLIPFGINFKIVFEITQKQKDKKKINSIRFNALCSERYWNCCTNIDKTICLELLKKIGDNLNIMIDCILEYVRFYINIE